MAPLSLPADLERRKAAASECAALSRLAMRSKAVWGYDEAFMEAAREELSVTPARLAEEHVVAAFSGGEPVGLYALSGPDEERGVILELFFVSPDLIGTGLGARLFEAAVADAQALGALRLHIESDPYAEGFYKKMGALKTGSAPSVSIPGRELPLLVYDLGA